MEEAVVERSREEAIQERSKFLMKCADRVTGGATKLLRSNASREDQSEQYFLFQTLTQYYYALSDGYKRQQLKKKHRTQPSKIAAITGIACASAGIIHLQRLRDAGGANLDDLDDQVINARFGVYAGRLIVGCRDISLDTGSSTKPSDAGYVFDPTYMRLLEHLMRLGSRDPLTAAEKAYLDTGGGAHDVRCGRPIAHGAINPFADSWRTVVSQGDAPYALSLEQIAYMQWMITTWQALELAHSTIESLRHSGQ